MYDICFIDDTIPVTRLDDTAETGRLNRSNLQLIIKEVEDWPEDKVRSLVIALLKDEESWNVSAFINPNIYLNCVENESYRPDIIIYDWEYAGGPADSSSLLLEILRTTFSVVYIYSGGDNKSKIDQALQQTDLSCFNDKRLFLLMKDEENSHQTLLSEAKRFYERNFSFRFGSTLRKATITALDKVLIDLGSSDIDFVTRLLADGNTKETDTKRFVVEKVRHYLLENETLRSIFKKFNNISNPTINEFITFLVSKLSDRVNSTKFSESLPTTIKTDYTEDIGISRRMWSQRIYYKPSDTVVRKGDIVKKIENGNHYLVVTADCDLNKFWHKNFGFINLVPLYSCTRDFKSIKDKLGCTLNEKQMSKQFDSGIHSIIDTIGGLVEGPFMCPFILENGDISDYVGFPKEMLSVHIAPPALKGKQQPGERKNISLLYAHWEGHERISTISEPFLTSLIQHCLQSISGYGTPDYPKIVQDDLVERLKSALFTGK